MNINMNGNLQMAAIICLIVLAVLYYFGYLSGFSSVSSPQEIVKREHMSVKKERRNYHDQINQNKQSNLNDLKRTLNLATLYLNGVPDRYDLNGKKIHGIAPKTRNAIIMFTRAAEMGYQPALYQIAKIYHYGTTDLDPNLENARKFYRHILILNSNYRLCLLAQDKINEIDQERQSAGVYAWLNLPRPLAKSKNPMARFKPKGSTGTSTSANVINIDKVFRVPPGQQTQINTLKPAQDEDDGQIKNDMHNVHDHAVITTLKQSYNKLNDGTKRNIPKNQCCREIRNFINQYAHNDKKKDALTALNAVERNVIPHTGIGATEADALAVVWNRMSDKFSSNSDTQKTIKENLADGLADMIEHGKVCCGTGRFSRILDSLNVIDEDVEIKPTFIINQEMMNKAAVISKNLLDAAPKGVRDDYNNGKSNSKVAELETSIKNKIRSDLHQDYVTSNILTEEGFEAQISKWIDNI